MPREVIEIGPFAVEAVQVTHSIVDAIGLAIRTPAGTVIHAGYFKIDHTPVDGSTTDIATVARYGEEGVLALLSDSTNALVPGHCPSERSVGSALADLFARTRGRIVITTFASHIHRVQQVLDLAVRHRRKVFLVGRSLVDNIETADRLGYVRFPREARPGANARPEDFAEHEVVIMSTGTHGEVFIDSEAEEVPEVVVRDRQHLAEDGFVIVVVAIDSNGRLVRDPEIITRGLVHVDASGDVLEDVRAQLVQLIAESRPDEMRELEVVQEKMRAQLKRYFRKEMGRRPMILPVIWEM